ncbi:MAG: hypothetical protein HY303_00430 [Candidatus Wallbacteria bacterium]|nr:hypothetical protein [Candidatus Wallbacteria bacterium]
MKPDRTDKLLALGLAATAGLFAAGRIRWSMPPLEDAAMLLRYSQHVAAGHGIVWNLGAPPVDGATDFLFMMVVAGLAWLGLAVETACRVVTLSSHVTTVALVYLAARQLYDAPRPAAAFSAAFLAAGPGVFYVEACFGTPFFALWACITWWFAATIAQGRDSVPLELGFGLSALALGLTRPEGVFLGVFLLAAVVAARGLQASRRSMATWAFAVGGLGGAYFLWRWHYFGHPLPNPFYRKGGGHLYLDSLRESVRNLVIMAMPFWPAFALGLRSPASRRHVLRAAIPTGCFTAIWVLLSQEMNFVWRFQYALLPLLLIEWHAAVGGLAAELKWPPAGGLPKATRKSLTLALAVAAMSFLMLEQWGIAKHRGSRDGRYEVARVLAPLAGRGYTIATTEAGTLPFYSGWNAIDAWGLNDSWIAHHGGITEEYLESSRPAVIVFHEYFSPLAPRARGGPWYQMVMTLKGYAEKRGYCLAACYGESPFNTHYYYVRDDLPESRDLVARIRAVDYPWVDSGTRCLNFALFAPAPACLATPH